MNAEHTNPYIYDSAKLIVNTERYKTNRDRRQTTEYDFDHDAKRKNDSIKGAGEKYERKIKRREKDAKPPKKDKSESSKTPLCRFLFRKCRK